MTIILDIVMNLKPKIKHNYQTQLDKDPIRIYGWSCTSNIPQMNIATDMATIPNNHILVRFLNFIH